jgi:hypothetical protein
MNTSMDSTVEFMNHTGVHLYYAEARSPKSCRNFDRLSSLTSDLSLTWADATKGDGEERGYVMGLYLEKNQNSSSQPSTLSEAAIILRTDSNKWTLIHEFFHHNFSVQAQKQGFSADKTKKAFIGTLTQLQQIDDDLGLSELEKIQKQIPAIAKVIRLNDELLMHFALEEIAIESELQSRFLSFDLNYVPESQYLNASWYICSSAQNAYSKYDQLSRLIDKFSEQAKLLGVKEEELKAISESSQIAFLHQMEAKRNGLRADPSCFGSSSQEQVYHLTLRTSPKISPPCNHSDDAQHFLTQAHSSLSKTLHLN